jgi:putative transcriptional regulator
MAIVRRVKELRALRGLTQSQLAALLGLGTQAVQDLEASRTKSIPEDTLNKLCRELQCQPGDLQVYVPDKPESPE